MKPLDAYPKDIQQQAFIRLADRGLTRRLTLEQAKRHELVCRLLRIEAWRIYSRRQAQGPPNTQQQFDAKRAAAGDTDGTDGT